MISEQQKLAYLKYSALKKDDRRKIDWKIRDIWEIMGKEYQKICSQDKELCQAYDEIKRIEKILHYDFKSNFEVYSHTENEFDPECAQRVYEYSEEKYIKCKFIAENWAEIKSKILAKIEKLKTSKFVIAREARISKLEQELEKKQKIVDMYNEAVKKEEQRKQQAEHMKEFWQLKDKYEAKLAKIAQPIYEKYLKENPILACRYMTHTVSGLGRTFSMEKFARLSFETHRDTQKEAVNVNEI